MAPPFVVPYALLEEQLTNLQLRILTNPPSKIQMNILKKKKKKIQNKNIMLHHYPLKNSL
jgi:hypothetical protein